MLFTCLFPTKKNFIFIYDSSDTYYLDTFYPLLQSLKDFLEISYFPHVGNVCEGLSFLSKRVNEEFVCINMDDDLLLLGNILRLKEFYVSNKSDEVGILGDTVRVFTEKKGDSVKVTETKLFSCISSCYGKTPFVRLKNIFNMEAWQGFYPKQTICKYIDEAAKIQLA